MKVNIGPYPENEENRKIVVKIDHYDIWNLYLTLANIIVPALEKFREDVPCAPYILDEDVPEHLHSINGESDEKDEYEFDSLYFERWNWVLDEMIWSFKQIRDLFNTKDFNHSIENNNRIDIGLRLFGKYYRGLWT